jgi:hypothetical protein
MMTGGWVVSVITGICARGRRRADLCRGDPTWRLRGAPCRIAAQCSLLGAPRSCRQPRDRSPWPPCDSGASTSAWRTQPPPAYDPPARPPALTRGACAHKFLIPWGAHGCAGCVRVTQDCSAWYLELAWACAGGLLQRRKDTHARMHIGRERERERERERGKERDGEREKRTAEQRRAMHSRLQTAPAAPVHARRADARWRTAPWCW